MSTRTLNMTETTKLGLPFGGTWRFRQEPVLADHATKKGLILAWDTPNASKIFGIYQDYPKAELMQRLINLPLEHRHCYEVIPKNDMCIGYIVLKWSGAPDPTHAVLTRALKLLRQRCDEELGIKADPYCYCGTYQLEETHHVYHIIVQNLVFPNNHNGQMRAFFDLGMEEINPTVYTRNRQLLLPNCRASGGTAPLANMGSPNADSVQSHQFVTGPELPTRDQVLFDDVRNTADPRWTPDDKEPVRVGPVPAVVRSNAAVVPSNAAVVPSNAAVVPSNAAVVPSAGALSPVFPSACAALLSNCVVVIPSNGAAVPSDPVGAKRARVDQAPYALPFPASVLEEMLAAAGMRAVFATPPTMAAMGPEQQRWVFTSDQPRGPRPCLKCPAEKHAAGGFTVAAQGSAGVFLATYQCDQGACWNMPDAVLGTIRFDPVLRVWDHRLAPQFPLQALDGVMMLPFPVQILAELIMKAGGLAVAVATTHYLRDKSEWRIRVCPRPSEPPRRQIAKWLDTQEDSILFVKFQANVFVVEFQCSVQGRPRFRLGTVWLTSRGSWAVTAEELEF